MILNKTIAMILKIVNNVKFVKYIIKFIKNTKKTQLLAIAIIALFTISFTHKNYLYCLVGYSANNFRAVCSEFAIFIKENGSPVLWSIIHKSDMDIERPTNPQEEQRESYAYALGVESLINNMFLRKSHISQDFSVLVMVPNLAPSSPLLIANEDSNFTLNQSQDNINEAIRRRHSLIIDNITKGNYINYLYIADFSQTEYLENVNFNNNIRKYSGAIIPAIHTQGTLPIRVGYYAIIKADDMFYVFTSPGDFQLHREHLELKNDKRTFLIFTRSEFMQTNYYKYIQSSLLRRVENLEHKNKIKRFISE